MSIQPTDPAAISAPVVVYVRTIHDVEADLAAARYTQKRGPARVKPCDVTKRDAAVNTLLEEWAAMHYARMMAALEPA